MKCMDKTSISVRDLQQNLKRVLERVERGHVIEVTRRRRPVARLAPVRSATAAEAWPDLAARTHEVFGQRTFATEGSDTVSEGRGTR